MNKYEHAYGGYSPVGFLQYSELMLYYSYNGSQFYNDTKNVYITSQSYNIITAELLWYNAEDIIQSTYYATYK